MKGLLVRVGIDSTDAPMRLASGEFAYVAEDTIVTFHVRGDELVLEGAPVHV